jgi:hypothetical protein
MRWIPRVGQVNAVPVSLYFAPIWGVEALRSLLSPVYGLDDRVNLAAAAFYNHMFDFGRTGFAGTASLLAGIKLLAASLFVAYVIDFSRGVAIGRDSDRSTLDTALLLAASVIVIWALPAFIDHNAEMIRLYATQFLLVMGAVIVTLVEQTKERAPMKLTRGQLSRATHRAQTKAAIAERNAPARTLNILTFERVRESENTH